MVRKVWESPSIVVFHFAFILGLTGDGYCSKCNSGYIGSNCDISLVGLCVPTIIGSILLIVGLYFAAQFFVKR